MGDEQPPGVGPGAASRAPARGWYFCFSGRPPFTSWVRRAVPFCALLLGCGGASPAAQPTSPATPASPTAPSTELPIPADLREPIARSIAIGQELYTLDKVAAIGTDVLLANVQDVQNAGIAGYLPMHEADDSGESSDAHFVDLFFTSDDPPRVAYEVKVSRDVPPTFEAFDPPRPVPPGFEVIVEARQVALEALPAIEQPLNPVLMPAAVIGEKGLLVYLLAGTKQPNVAVLGKHYRAVVPLGGSKVSSLQALSNSILEIPTREASGEPVVGLALSHVVTDYPLETHVFASLVHKLPIMVATRRGVWLVNGAKVAYFGEKGP